MTSHMQTRHLDGACDLSTVRWIHPLVEVCMLTGLFTECFFLLCCISDDSDSSSESEDEGGEKSLAALKNKLRDLNSGTHSLHSKIVKQGITCILRNTCTYICMYNCPDNIDTERPYVASYSCDSFVHVQHGCCCVPLPNVRATWHNQNIN